MKKGDEGLAVAFWMLLTTWVVIAVIKLLS